MNSKLWIRKALSLCLCVAILATYSMVALAGPRKVAGELTVSGKEVNGEAPFVLVNGEAARSGRSVFSASTITTSDGVGAVINLGKLGRVELAPATVLNLSFDDAAVSGELASGTVSVFGTSEKISIKTLNGKTVELGAGQSVSASGGLQDDDDDDDGGAAWWVWAAVFAGASAGILWAALRDDDLDLGGGTTVISPTR
ncbi:MAG TPA: hypothetical protein VFZ23_15290 [Pyrinomonadaceae bacterium]